MSIDLSMKLDASADVEKTNAKDLIWDEIEEGMYDAELVIVYPWKEYTKDTKVRIKDEEGKYVKDENGRYKTELQKDVNWFSTEMVFKIKNSIYDGYGVKGSISTHPSMIGSAKRFLYSARLFDVELKDLFKNTGTMVKVMVKTKTEEYKDKDGIDVVKHSPYVSYYERFESEETTE